MTINPLEPRNGASEEELIEEQLRVLCSYYLATDDFGRGLMLSTGRTQATKHPIQLPRQLRLVPRSGLDHQAQLIDQVIQSFPLTVVR